ncbi:MAG: GtrA family protein [Pseudomonadota bacterium]
MRRERLTTPSRQRLVSEGWRIMRFGAVGIAATLTHLGVLFGLVELAGVAPSLANPIAVALAVPVSYFGHYHLTFGATQAHGQTMMRFAVVALSTLVVSQACILGVRALGGPYQIAVPLFLVLAPLVNYVLFGKLVFRRRAPS